MCDNIDEIYDELINLLKKKQTKILENHNEISIIIPLEAIKIKEILFILKEITKKDEENIKDLIVVISEMKKEIKQLKEKLNNSNEKNIELNNKIIFLEQENKLFKQKFEKIENFMPFIESLKFGFNIDIDSLIIGNNENYKKNLKNFVGPERRKFQLLFRMTRDGDNFTTFHRLCDNQGPTITLYKLEDNNVLGLYTPLSWNTTSNWINDQKMFLFSLTENKKSNKNNKDSRGIFCYPTHGPNTDFIKIFTGTTMKRPTIDPSAPGYDNCQELYPNKKPGTYTCLEIEVFKII